MLDAATRRASLVPCLSLFCLCSVASAQTQTGQQPAPAVAHSAAEPSSELSEAKRHFDEGRALFAAHDYRAAIREFELAVAIAPSADLWFDIGRAHDELMEREAAIEAYERYLHDRVDARDRDEVSKRIAVLKRQVEEKRAERPSAAGAGTLRVNVGTPGALVMVDGHFVGHAPLTEPLVLSPGRHRLGVTESGYVPFQAEVQVEPGTLTSAYAALSARSEVRAVQRARVWTWILASVAGAGLVTSAGLGMAAFDRRGQNDPRLAARFGDASELVLGGAALCALSATIAYFLEGQSAQTETYPLARK